MEPDNPDLDPRGACKSVNKTGLELNLRACSEFLEAK